MTDSNKKKKDPKEGSGRQDTERKGRKQKRRGKTRPFWKKTENQRRHPAGGSGEKRSKKNSARKGIEVCKRRKRKNVY